MFSWVKQAHLAINQTKQTILKGALIPDLLPRSVVAHLTVSWERGINWLHCKNLTVVPCPSSMTSSLWEPLHAVTYVGACYRIPQIPSMLSNSRPTVTLWYTFLLNFTFMLLGLMTYLTSMPLLEPTNLMLLGRRGHLIFSVIFPTIYVSFSNLDTHRPINHLKSIWSSHYKLVYWV